MNSSQHISPFKFLDSYTREDRDIFFGREREVEEVFSKAFQSQMLLIYGASGTGKSSIINCGLANKFKDTDWLPIHIRRGGNIRRSMFNQIQKNAIHKVDLGAEEEMSNEGMIKALNSVFLDHFKPIYLIFDQFEELFIFGLREEWQDFISVIREILNRDLEVRLIFIIRGEYLEFLSEFEEELPNFFDNRVRIEKMTRKNAENIISGPVSQFPIDVEEGFEENLIKKLSPGNSQIELTFLQVFLDKIYKMSLELQGENERLKFTNEQIEKLGQVGDVLAEFVDEQLFRMPNPKQALTVLKSFVSLQGTKVQRNTEEVIAYTRDIGQLIDEQEIDDIIAELINKRILKEQDDNGRYELRHDSLAGKIFEKITVQERELLDVRQFLSHSYNEYQKRGTLLKDEDLSYIAPHERQLNLDEALLEFLETSRQNSSRRKKQRRTRNVVVLIIAFLLVTSVIALFNAQKQKHKAEMLAALAQSQASEAERQKNLARKQEKNANEQAEIANQQKLIAEASREESEKQKQIAEQQRLIAEKEKQKAELSRREALINADEAQKQKQIAIREKNIADEQRVMANTLRMHTLARELALKSRHVIDPQLKGLLSGLAFDFNRQFNGKAFQPEIYEALYFANRELNSNAIRESRIHFEAVKSFIVRGAKIYTASSDGKIAVSQGENMKESDLIADLGLVIECMQMDSKETYSYLGTNNGQLARINVLNPDDVLIKQIHDGKVKEIILTPNGIFTFGLDGMAGLLNNDLDLIKTLQFTSELISAELINNRIYVADSRGSIHILNENIEVLNSFKPYNSQKINTLKFDPQTAILGIGYERGEIILWDVNKNEAFEILPGHTAAVTDLAFDPKGRFLISGSYDRSLRIWTYRDQETAPVVIPDHQNWVSKVGFDQKGEMIFSTDYNGNFRSIPIEVSALKDAICKVLQRSMTHEEWSEYISSDISFQTTCNE
jgi:hypothetical protein